MGLGGSTARAAALFVAAAVFFAGTSAATVYRVGTAANLTAKTALLQPGDELIASNGTYSLTTWNIQNLSGTRTNWITIRGEGNPVIQGTSSSANVIQFQNAHYIILSNFEVISTAPATAGIDGVNIKGTESSYLTLDHLNIHGMGNNGISIFATEASFITLRNSEIASNITCGLYWGYPARNVVHDVLVENNHIHHCPLVSTTNTGYGIQFKGGCFRGRFIDNVLHDVGGTSRSGIIIYYGKTNPAGDVPDDMNIVRGNVLWNCRNEGITAMSDALIENNIVFDAVLGIHLQTYSDELGGPNYVENLVVRNNTAFRCSSACISVPTSDWTPGTVGPNVAFTGNAAYQTNTTLKAISGTGGTGSERLASNVFYGASDLPASAASAGKGLADFRNVTAATAVPNLDFHPSASSALTNRIFLVADMPERDFNGTPRPWGTAADAGAYEYTTTTNPGFALQPTNKPVITPAAPVIQLFARSDATNYNFVWPRVAQWAQVEFCTDLTSNRWISLAGPLYATNATVTPPAGTSNGFFRLRLE